MIKIAHLYYDLMNLYGDNGNIKALVKALESQGVKTKVDYLSVDDEIDFNSYDLFYIGPGTFNNEKIVLTYLLKYREDIRKAFYDKKFFLITGNALEMFGNTIIDGNDELEGIGILDFVAEKRLNNLVSEVYAKCGFLNDYLLGFKNQDSTIEGNNETFIDVIQGYGLTENNKKEGFMLNNFIGTYLIGPILVRNPEFLIYLAKRIIDSKYDNFEYKPFDLDFEIKAHDEYLKLYFNEETK